MTNTDAVVIGVGTIFSIVFALRLLTGTEQWFDWVVMVILVLLALAYAGATSHPTDRSGRPQ